MVEDFKKEYPLTQIISIQPPYTQNSQRSRSVPRSNNVLNIPPPNRSYPNFTHSNNLPSNAPIQPQLLEKAKSFMVQDQNIGGATLGNEKEFHLKLLKPKCNEIEAII